jgi:hypothetical protein
MNTSLFRLFAGSAWAAALIASAAPADATAFTSQIGGYASCSGAYTPYANSFETCELKATEYVPGYVYYTSYTQVIKFASVGCNAGGCSSDTGTVYTDIVYETGRKVTTLYERVCGATKSYGIGICAC